MRALPEDLMQCFMVLLSRLTMSTFSSSIRAVTEAAAEAMEHHIGTNETELIDKIVLNKRS